MLSSAIPEEVLDSTQRTRWEAAFEQLPSELRDINYSFRYHLLYEKNGDGSMRLFLYREGAALFYYPFLIRPILNKVIAEGYNDIETVYGYTGPLCTTTDPEFIKRAMYSFRGYCSNHKIVSEFIRFHPLLQNQKNFSTDPELKIVSLRDYVYVDLQRSEEEIWDAYTSQNRNKIRKSEKLGVYIESGFQEEAYKKFVEMYLDNMRQVKAARMYFFSDSFFEELAQLIQANGKFLVARNENEILGSAVFLAGTEIGHYFLAAATAEGKKAAAGNLLLHHGIQWSKREGMKKLHLGGGVSQDANDPLLVFKNNFSQLIEKFYIGKRIHNHEIYSILTEDWDRNFPEESVKYKSILQRYRWTKDDLL